MSDSFKKESRKDWHRDDAPSMDDIKVGALQRIADATEKMAQRHTDLMRDVDNYKRWYEQERQSHAATIRQLRAARGVITKLRKQLADARKPVQGDSDGR